MSCKAAFFLLSIRHYDTGNSHNAATKVRRKENNFPNFFVSLQQYCDDGETCLSKCMAA
jgi:hypothetical protein